MKLAYTPAFDPGFVPLSLLLRDFQARVAQGPAIAFGIAVERSRGQIATYTLDIFPENTGHDDENIYLVERIVKTLLWAYGGFRIYFTGSVPVAQAIAMLYCHDGEREFDRELMARVYEHAFEVLYVDALPEANTLSTPIGRHLDGCRIGFDAGGSDRKVSAVVDGVAIYSEEVVWFPKTTADPAYHYEGILTAFQTAAGKMPRVDAIGVSSAGIYIDNRIMNASLFLAVPKEAFDDEVKDMYIRAAKAIGDVPLTVANDGDVTALAGAMELNDTNIMGIAMGTSEAGGFIDELGNITGWLNELAFVPVDANPNAMRDEWSGDIGCGVKYFSQDGAIKLAGYAGIEIDAKLSPGEKLKIIQGLLSDNDPRAVDIFKAIGVYLGYALGWYAEFYEIKHLLLMGRVTSGQGGPLMIDMAEKVLAADFPNLSKTLQIHLPDEQNRRVGQSVAAASLPRS